MTPIYTDIIWKGNNNLRKYHIKFVIPKYRRVAVQSDEINNNPTRNLDNGFLKKAHFKNSCGEIINVALSVPGVHVLAVGPESCLRVLYFRALRKNLLDRLQMLTISRTESDTGVQIKLLESALEQMIVEERKSLKAIIVYVSCIDILMVSDFDSVLRPLELKFNIPIRLFKRGPLSKRRVMPKERLSLIFSEILDFYSEHLVEEEKTQSSSVNILGEIILSPNSELKQLLIQENVHCFNNFMDCICFEDLLKLKNAKASVVTHKFGVNIAKYLEKSYNIPYCFVPNKYCFTDIEMNYKNLSEILQIELDYNLDKRKFLKQLESMPHIIFTKTIAIGGSDNTLELSKALLEWGFKVKIVLLDSIIKEDIKKIDEIKRCYEETQIISTPSISMKNQQEIFKDIELSIGKLAASYCVNAKKVVIEEKYDFGFQNAFRVLSELHEQDT